MKSLLLLSLMTLCGCANFNRTDRQRLVERLEHMQSSLLIEGDSAQPVADLAMERGRLWLRNNGRRQAGGAGSDTLSTEPTAMNEFGYRIVRIDSTNSVRLDITQQAFGDWFDGTNSRRLALFMASGSDHDSSLPLFSPALTSYYVQFGGEGFFTSLHLERIVLPHFAARVGIGMWVTSLLSGAESGLVVPVTASWISGPNRGFEVGAGASLFVGKRYPIGDDRLVAFTYLGYRNVPVEGGMVLRVSFTPRYSFSMGRFLLEAPLFGFGIGHTL